MYHAYLDVTDYHAYLDVTASKKPGDKQGCGVLIMWVNMVKRDRCGGNSMAFNTFVARSLLTVLVIYTQLAHEYA